MGPLTTSRGVDKARRQVGDAVQHGAKIAHGGGPCRALRLVTVTTSSPLSSAM